MSPENVFRRCTTLDDSVMLNNTPQSTASQAGAKPDDEATGVGFVEFWGQTHGLTVLNIVFPLIWQISSGSADPTA
jgi:hypothetical protein